MLFSREVYERVGGLDPEMFWMEDVDLCVRVRISGGTCFYVNGPGITHLGGQSASKNVKRAISNQLISRIKFARKHAGPLVALMLSVVIELHVITRILAFAVLFPFRPDQRLGAYVFTFGKLQRYLFLGDRTI